MPYALARCRHGTMLVNPSDVFVGRSLLTYGDYSEGEVELFRALIPPDGVVIEAGANIGAHTVPIARIAHTVIAFEPQRLIHQLLCANVALNGLYNVQTVHGGCDRRNGMISVPCVDPEQPNNFGGVSIGGADAEETVPVFAIDSLGLARVDFIKADVEGMERDVFAGARHTLTALRPVCYFENDRKENSRKLLAMMERFGYRMWWHMVRLFDADNFNGVAENVFGAAASLNVLAVPSERSFDCNLDPVEGPSDWPGLFKSSEDLSS